MPSLIRADVSWESLAVRHIEAVAEANEDASVAGRDSRKSGKFKKVCTTDPDATMATNGRNRRLEPSFKQRAVIDDACGAVLDVEVTSGEVNDGQLFIERIDARVETTGVDVGIVTADAGCLCEGFSGLDEILTCVRLKVSITIRRVTFNVKQWRSGTMALRWVAAG
jgi:hypothetical protein